MYVPQSFLLGVIVKQRNVWKKLVELMIIAFFIYIYMAIYLASNQKY